MVIKMPWVPSFALPFPDGARLYPAEAVGAAIEVKVERHDAVGDDQAILREVAHGPDLANELAA